MAKDPGFLQGTIASIASESSICRWTPLRSTHFQYLAMTSMRLAESKTLVVQPMHELVDKILIDDPEIGNKLQRIHDNGQLPPNYYTSPIVHRSVSLPLPLSLYMDGAPYSLTDSCLGVWIEELVTHRRLCIALVRKRSACHCGCRGWCTYWALLDWIRYCLQALGDQRWPLKRHDGSDWQMPQDSIRSSRSGMPLGMAGTLIQVRGDWMEFCNMLGYPSHASSSRPCFSCAADRGNWYNFAGCSPAGLTWHGNTDDDIEAAVARCENWVLLDGEGIRRVRSFLKYDKRPDGNLGRCVVQDLPEFGLRSGDRLEPSSSLRNVADFESTDLAPSEQNMFCSGGAPRRPFVCTAALCGV